MKFVCIKKCYHKGILYEEGQVIGAKEAPNKHFKEVIENAPVGEKVIIEATGEEVEVEEALSIEELQEELEKVGRAFDRRWGRSKLEMELQLVKAGK